MNTMTTPATLRDQFAMSALTGLLASSGDDALSPGDYAEIAFRYADAMLRERERPEDQTEAS